MTLALHIRFKGRCRRHPRYNPENDPAGMGIKAGCQFCFALHDLWSKAQKLEGEMARTAELLGKR